MSIPKILHRIWFGEPFDEKYQNYLKTLAELNPDYQTKLWSDRESMSEEAYQKLTIFCREHKIQLCNIRVSTELLNHDLILQELASAKMNPRLRRLHYVRASDIARIGILYHEGGIYSDTDSRALQPFDEMDAKHGILLKAHTGLEFKEMGYTGTILIDFIASTPEHELLNTAAKISVRDYQIYEKSQFREWENSEDGADLAYGCVSLSGSALRAAFEFHQYFLGERTFRKASEYFVFIDPYMSSDYDKSWLRGFEIDWEKENKSDVYDFINEIEHERKKLYLFMAPKRQPLLDWNIPIFEKVDLSQILFRPNEYLERSEELQELMQPKIIPFHFDIPVFQPPDRNIHFAPPEVIFNPSLISFSLKSKTKNEIHELYKKNGGGLLARFSIFYRQPNANSEEIIEALKERAESNPEGASQKTLNDLSS